MSDLLQWYGNFCYMHPHGLGELPLALPFFALFYWMHRRERK